MTTPSIIIIDELVLMDPIVKAAMETLVNAFVAPKSQAVTLTAADNGIPVPHNWGEVHGYGHKQEANPHCYQDVLQLEIEFLALKLELATALKARPIDQLIMCEIWENIEKCSTIQELKDIVF